MDKAEHGRRLRAGMAEHDVGPAAVIAATDASGRTVTNWRTGKTMPSDRDRAILRKLIPGYDLEGDPVELAVMRSRLTEDRQHEVVGYYKRRLREQDEEVSRGA